MRIFETIRKNREERAIAKALKIEEENKRREQLRQEEIKEKQEFIAKLLDAEVEKNYIVELHHYVVDTQGNSLYGVYDYFLCSSNILDFGYGDAIEAIKITGNNFGDKYVMYGHGYSISSIELTDRRGIRWEGRNKSPYIPSDCKTIRELNEYANKENIARKQKYEQKVADTQRVNNKFFK